MSPLKKGQSLVVNRSSSSLHQLETTWRDVVTLLEDKGGDGKKALLLFHKIVPISQLHEKGFVAHISRQWPLGYRLCCCQRCTCADCVMLQSHLCLPAQTFTFVPVHLATPSPGGKSQLQGQRWMFWSIFSNFCVRCKCPFVVQHSVLSSTEHCKSSKFTVI